MTNAREITKPLTSPLEGWRPKAKTARKKSEGRTEALMQYFRANVCEPDGTDVDNRRAAWSLILKLEKQYPGKDAVKMIEALIQAALTVPFHAKNLTKYKYLLDHGQRIANDYRAAKATGSASKMANVASRLANEQ